jgi:hypothetical protein
MSANETSDESKIEKFIKNKNWDDLGEKIIQIFNRELSAEEANKISHFLYSTLQDAGDHDKFVENIGNIVEERSPNAIIKAKNNLLQYVVRSGDLGTFTKLYGDTYFSLINDIKSITKTADNSIILDHVEHELQFLTSQQRKACLGGQIILLIQSRQTISIPINYLIDADKADSIIDNKTKYVRSAIQSFDIDTDNLGRGINSILENYDFKTTNMSFFQRNKEFLEKLTVRELVVLSGYTHEGDRLVNILLRKDSELNPYIDKIWHKHSKNPKLGSIIPIYFQLLDAINIQGSPKTVRDWIKTEERDENFYRIIKECIEQYINELKAVFDKAPKLESEMFVFRGTQTFYYGTDKSDVFINGDFTSASISPITALSFATNDCCFTQMKLKPGIKVIFIEPVTQHRGELEILIPPGHKFRIIKNKVKKLLSIPSAFNKSYEEFTCSESKKNIRFTLMENI